MVSTIEGQRTKFDVWEMGPLEAGNCLEGPATLEDPMTALVIPPHNFVEFHERRFIR